MNYKFSLLFTLILFLRCSNHSPTESRYIDCANGLWEASSGDIHVTNEIGLIAYNSYAIDTKSNIDSVRVTWDDGLSCTTTMATMHENKIELTVNDIYAIFTIINNEKASAVFISSKKQYIKQLIKKRDDPRVICE